MSSDANKMKNGYYDIVLPLLAISAKFSQEKDA